MGYLLFVTLIQAFSFSLIGEYLAGHVDSYFAVLVRVLLAGLVFLPLTRWRSVEPAFMRGMLLIGALQFGVTYVCLYLSFRVLTVPEVLLFTILTPLHVTLIEDALNRRFNPWALVAALVAVAGAAVIRFDRINPDFPRTDVVLIIGANDIVNPAAMDSPGSPIYGMPVLEVWKARTVVVLKRSMATGYSGVDNPLFYKENTVMLFGDARATVEAILGRLRVGADTARAPRSSGVPDPAVRGR